MTGAFVVVEGLDGTGKSTLAANLARELGGVLMATPGTAFRELREPVLEALGPDPMARALFYAGTVVSQGRHARRLADEGAVVVMDRYWLSTLVYARARGVAGLEALERLLPEPDATLLVTLDEVERIDRLFRRGDFTSADRETLDPPFRDCVLRGYRDASGGFRVSEVAVDGLDPEAAVRKASSVLEDLDVGGLR